MCEDVTDKEWYLGIEGQRQGPLSLEEIQTMAAEGKLSSSAVVWKEGMADWQPIRVVPDLSHLVGQRSVQPVNNTFAQKNTLSLSGMSKADVIKGALHYVQQTKYKVDLVDETGGRLVFAKKIPLSPVLTVTVQILSEDDQGTKVGVDVQGSISLNRKFAEKTWREVLQKAPLAAKYGTLSEIKPIGDDRNQAANTGFLQGMNQACGCIVAFALLFFLLILFASI